MLGRSSWFCCFKFWFWFLYASTLIFIVSAFIFWLIFLPQNIKFTISDASLTQFNLTTTPNSTLYYNLALNFTIRNPNKRVGLYYDRIQAIASYQKKRFGNVTLNASTPFYRGHKNTTIVRPVLQGQQLMVLKEKDLKKYDSEKTAGVYSIDVKLAFRLRARYGKIKTGHFKPPKVDCKLRIPLSSNGTSPAGNF